MPGSRSPGLLLPNSLRRLLSHGPNERRQGPSGVFLGRRTIFITFVPVFLPTHGVHTSRCCHPRNLATSWVADLTPDKVPCDSTGSLWGWRDLLGAESSLLKITSTHGSSKPPADTLCARGAEPPHPCLSPVPVLLTGTQSPSKKGVTPKLECLQKTPRSTLVSPIPTAFGATGSRLGGSEGAAGRGWGRAQPGCSTARRGASTRLGLARFGTARHGSARHGTALLGTARLGRARLGGGAPYRNPEPSRAEPSRAKLSRAVPPAPPIAPPRALPNRGGGVASCCVPAPPRPVVPMGARWRGPAPRRGVTAVPLLCK